MDIVSLVPLEFCHIGEPLLDGLCGIKSPVQKVICKELPDHCLSVAAKVVVNDCRTDISGPADAEHPLVIDMDTMVMA